MSGLSIINQTSSKFEDWVFLQFLLCDGTPFFKRLDLQLEIGDRLETDRKGVLKNGSCCEFDVALFAPGAVNSDQFADDYHYLFTVFAGFDFVLIVAILLKIFQESKAVLLTLVVRADRHRHELFINFQCEFSSFLQSGISLLL